MSVFFTLQSWASTTCFSMSDFLDDGCHFVAAEGYRSPVSDSTVPLEVGKVRVTRIRNDSVSPVPTAVALSDKVAYFIAPYLIGQPAYNDTTGSFALHWGDLEDIKPDSATGSIIPSSLVDKLSSAGVDVLLFDYLEADVRDFHVASKSLALQAAISDIESIRGNPGDDIIMFGFSLGGIIARHALLAMENDPALPTHNISTFISWDSPHLGANVPISLQASAEFAEEATWEAGTAAISLPLVFILLVGVMLTACGGSYSGQNDLRDASEAVALLRQKMLNSHAVKELLIQDLGSQPMGPFPVGEAPGYSQNPYAAQLHSDLWHSWPEESRNIAFFGGSYGEKNDMWNTATKYFEVVTNDAKEDTGTEWQMTAYVGLPVLEQSVFTGAFYAPYGPYPDGGSNYLNKNSPDTSMCSQEKIPVPFADAVASFLGTNYYFDLNQNGGTDSTNFAESSCFIPTVSAAAIPFVGLNETPASLGMSVEDFYAMSPFDDVFYASAGDPGDHYIHFSDDYWENAPDFQMEIDYLIASTYGSNVDCSINNASASHGGFGIHDLKVINSGSTTITDWSVDVVFSDGEPVVGWMYGADNVSTSGSVITLSGSTPISPSQFVQMGLGGNYSGPSSGISLSCE